ncbi:MAG TPA: diguanylate cyclase [Chloroflexota bacterium]|nr:diguanylate cyclase [Chloroflexota bacterium]
MQVGSAVDGRLKACLFAGWLTLCAALVASTADGGGRLVTISAVLVAACAGLLRRDWREALAIGLAGAALTAWMVSGDERETVAILAATGVVLTALLAAWSRESPLERATTVPTGDRQAQPTPAGVRMPPGVADETLFDRLAVHEMTRARRYERPLVLLLIGVDGWSAMVAERGRRGALDNLATLATRVRRLLRDVDAIGMHGDGRLAVLLPETPLDGAMVVAGWIQQTVLQDVRLRAWIGAAVFPDDAVTVEALLREAEAGLDLARIEGVSTVERVCLGSPRSSRHPA